MFDVQVVEESIAKKTKIRNKHYVIVKRELAEWFIAISLKLILVKPTNIRSNRIFSVTVNK